MPVFGRLLKFGTKSVLAGGVIFMYYESGLWKGVDESIFNYAKLKGEWNQFYETAPFVKDTCEVVATSATPYSQVVTDFKKEWFNYDISWIIPGSERGVIKPAWNKCVMWTTETIANSPETVPALASKAWNYVSSLSGAEAESPQKSEQ